jgi:UDP-N-acetyl-D-glucosamine/UDP-N-acetyl-D-galactosamine dehydrogenase
VNKDNSKIAIIGLGYVGLPLAAEFGKIIDTIGFDINVKRIKDLNAGKDSTLEVNTTDLNKAKKLKFTYNLIDLNDCNIFIVTVPTPIDEHKKPDLAPLINATEAIGKILKLNDIVIYESTVYPGATEEICVPILEKISNLVFNTDFYCGYSPERINPGDKEHTVTSIRKITSGSTPEIANRVDELYNKIILAGTYKAESIKVAEAAKVIENTQRDVNIALINELAMIFNKLDIDTQAVLNAASTKWNFLQFWPGLVGGHCIGVDPYYLTHKALEVGYRPEMILAGRRINDNMGSYIVKEVIRLMNEKQIKVNDSNILILGLTFKENCPDLRNTRVIDIINILKENGCNIDVYDPWANEIEMMTTYSLHNVKKPRNGSYDTVILAVAHDEFVNMSLNEIKAFGKKKNVIYDIKYLFNENQVDGRL